MLKPLNHAIGSCGDNSELWANHLDRLVVIRRNRDFIVTQNLPQARLRLDRHRVERVSVRISLVADVLVQRATAHRVEQLESSTDGEYRNVGVYRRSKNGGLEIILSRVVGRLGELVGFGTVRRG